MLINSKLAIVGGTGVTRLESFTEVQRYEVETPYGKASAPILGGTLYEKPVFFLARHGLEHQYPPHLINYRANLWALNKLGVDNIISTNAVGGISQGADSELVVIPDQIIDYTYKRETSFAAVGEFLHVDFSYPFCQHLRGLLINAAQSMAVNMRPTAVYGCTEGPRLETAAEIKRMENDGCDVVGMTCMPEAALARELNISYASICLVVNPAAGKSSQQISMAEIEKVLSSGMKSVYKILEQAVSSFADFEHEKP